MSDRIEVWCRDHPRLSVAAYLALTGALGGAVFVGVFVIASAAAR